MNSSANVSLRLCQRGQALAEFQVATVFFLLPAFLFLPLLFKMFAQQRHASDMVNYLAWERTVWLNTAPFESRNHARKTANLLIEEAQSRIGLQHGEPMPASDSNPNGQHPGLSAENREVSLSAIPRNHRTRRFFTESHSGTAGKTDILISESGLKNVGSAWQGNALELVKPVFGHNPDGLIEVTAFNRWRKDDWHPWWGKEELKTDHHSKARLSILTDSWIAEDNDHIRRMTQELIPTHHLQKLMDFESGLKTIGGTVGSIIPWIEPLEKIELGHVNPDAIPTQRTVVIQ